MEQFRIITVCVGCGKVQRFRCWSLLTDYEKNLKRKGEINIEIGKCFDCEHE